VRTISEIDRLIKTNCIFNNQKYINISDDLIQNIMYYYKMDCYLTNIPLIQRIIWFAAENPVDLSIYASVHSSWAETVRYHLKLGYDFMMFTPEI